MDSLYFDYSLSRISHCLKQKPQSNKHLCDTQPTFCHFYDLSQSRIYPYLKQIFCSLQVLRWKQSQEGHGSHFFWNHTLPEMLFHLRAVLQYEIELTQNYHLHKNVRSSSLLREEWSIKLHLRSFEFQENLFRQGWKPRIIFYKA